MKVSFFLSGTKIMGDREEHYFWRHISNLCPVEARKKVIMYITVVGLVGDSF